MSVAMGMLDFWDLRGSSLPPAPGFMSAPLTFKAECTKLVKRIGKRAYWGGPKENDKAIQNIAETDKDNVQIFNQLTNAMG